MAEITQGWAAREATNPLPNSSLCALEPFVEVEAVDQNSPPARLSLPFSREALGWVDPASLRVFEVDGETRSFRLLPDAELGPNVVHAQIEKPGIYGLIGLPLDPDVGLALLAFRRQHKDLMEEKARGDRKLHNDLCERILCSGPYRSRYRKVGDERSRDICRVCLDLDIPEVGLPEFALLHDPRDVRPPPLIEAHTISSDLEIVERPESFYPTWKRVVFDDFPWSFSSSETFRIEEDRTGLQQLTTSPGFDEEPRWSTNGRRIVFTSSRNGHGPEIWIMDADGANQTCLTPRSVWGQERQPCFSPSGNQIVFSRSNPWGCDIMIMNSDGSNLQTLTTTKNITTSHVGDLEPEWSPDGQTIFFVSDRAATYDFELWRVKPDGTGLQQVTNAPVGVHLPRCSPDGQTIVFCGITGSSTFEIYKTDVTGANVTRLTQPQPAQDFDPTWWPDGSQIMFSRSGKLHMMNEDGSGQAIWGGIEGYHPDIVAVLPWKGFPWWKFPWWIWWWLTYWFRRFKAKRPIKRFPSG